MFALGGFLIAGLLVLTRTSGFGFNGQFVVGSLQRLQPNSHHLGRLRLSLILSLEWNRAQGIAVSSSRS